MQNVVIISEDLAKALNQYLGVQPFDQVANLIVPFRQSVVPQLQNIEKARIEAKAAEVTPEVKPEAPVV